MERTQLLATYIRGWRALPGFGLVFVVEPMWTTHIHARFRYQKKYRPLIFWYHAGTLTQDWFYRWASRPVVSSAADVRQ